MVHEEIRAVLAAKADALVRRSTADLERLLDPGFLYVNAGGTVFDRDSYVATYCSSGRVAFRRQEIVELLVREFPAFVVARMVVDDAFEVGGTPVEKRFRSLCVFHRGERSWLWASGQTAHVE
jgi:hypothetical protein